MGRVKIKGFSAYSALSSCLVLRSIYACIWDSCRFYVRFLAVSSLACEEPMQQEKGFRVYGARSLGFRGSWFWVWGFQGFRVWVPTQGFRVEGLGSLWMTLWFKVREFRFASCSVLFRLYLWIQDPSTSRNRLVSVLGFRVQGLRRRCVSKVRV